MNFSIESMYGWYRETIRNPKYRWWIIGGSLLYLVSPINIATDMFPVVGWIDDGVIATLLVAEISQLLLDRLKAGKDTTAAGSANPSPASDASDTTVDVNSVSVK
jgi:uncharacterized membrane protein YkvA (DUF1232 family)